MNRGITSAPMNWAIDYGQNRSGEIMGNAIGNTGSMLGNAIMQYAADKKKKDEEKLKKDAAIKFLGKQGIPEEEAKGIVNGVGIDNFLKFKQVDQDQQQIKQRQQQIDQDAARIKAQDAQIAQKAQELQKREASIQQFMGQVSGSAPWRNPAARTQQDVYAAAARTGVDPELATRVASGMPDPKRPSDPVEFIQDPVTGARYMKQGNSVLPSNPPKGQKPLENGSEEDITIGGRTVRAVYVGGGNYIDKATKAPLYVYQEDPNNPYVKIPSPNPILFGVDAARMQAPAGQPAASATSGGVPVVKTQKEYDDLPVGASYIDSAGKRAVKQKR